MYLRKLKSGKWECQLRVRNQKISKTFLSKSEGRAWGIEKTKEIYEGSNLLSLQKYTLRDLLIKYLETSLTGLKENTKESYSSQIQKLLRDYNWLLIIKLCDLTPEHFEKFKKVRLQDRGSKHTKTNHRAVNNDLGLFSRVLNTARKIWFIPVQNSASVIKKLKEQKGKRIQLSKDTYKRLLNYGNDRVFRIIIMIQKHTGLRPSEVHNLKWNDLDDYRLKLYIRNPKNNVPREVDITQFLANEINKLSKNNEFIIPISQEAMKKRFQRAKRKLNLIEVDQYDFRRYRTQRLINANILNGVTRNNHIGYVSTQLGHQSFDMVSRYYGTHLR